MFKALFRSWRARKTLERYVSPEVAGQTISGDFPQGSQHLDEREIEFVFVTVSAAEVATCSERLAFLAELGGQHGGSVLNLLPVTTVAWGILPGTVSAEGRLRFIAAAQARFPDLSFVHGSVSVSIGNFGSAHQMEMGFWWPGMSAALRRLGELSPGQIVELPTA